MKNIFFLFALFISFPLMARDIETDIISLQAMDKITGRVKTLTFSVGSQTKFGELTIKADRCLTKSPEETPENSAFLRVFQDEKELFKGWMFSSNPSLSAMENDVYDIWVVSCKKQEVQPEVVVEEQVESENIEPVSVETDVIESENEEEIPADSNEPIED